MTSVLSYPKQTNGHFIALSSIALKAYTPGTGSGASFTVGSFAPNTSAGVSTNSLLKDMGQTIVSSLRVFRKVAPVAPVGVTANPYTGGDVSFGVSTTTSGTVALVGYIELGYEGFGGADPVARYNLL